MGPRALYVLSMPVSSRLVIGLGTPLCANTPTAIMGTAVNNRLNSMGVIGLRFSVPRSHIPLRAKARRRPATSAVAERAALVESAARRGKRRAMNQSFASASMKSLLQCRGLDNGCGKGHFVPPRLRDQLGFCASIFRKPSVPRASNIDCRSTSWPERSDIPCRRLEIALLAPVLTSEP
jgi:hypothetical protein